MNMQNYEGNCKPVCYKKDLLRALRRQTLKKWTEEVIFAVGSLEEAMETKLRFSSDVYEEIKREKFKSFEVSNAV